jgi:adenine deaminase
MLCTDDSHPGDLLKGHINQLVSRGVEIGLDVFNLLKAAMLNAKKFYNLPVGSLNIGDPADFVLVDNLVDFTVHSTYIKGKAVYQNGNVDIPSRPSKMINQFNSQQIAYCDIQTPYRGRPVKVIEAMDGELLTGSTTGMPRVVNDQLKSEPTSDILKLVVVNRYQKQKPSVGFIKGFGLSSGALATTIAHDSHNIICVGASDEDIEKAINRLMDLKGGIAFVDKEIISELPLPIAGLISDKPAGEVDKRYQEILRACASRQCKLKSPVMTLSFMSLLVIPSLKLGDQGLFDVDKFAFTAL